MVTCVGLMTVVRTDWSKQIIEFEKLAKDSK